MGSSEALPPFHRPHPSPTRQTFRMDLRKNTIIVSVKKPPFFVGAKGRWETSMLDYMFVPSLKKIDNTYRMMNVKIKSVLEAIK